MNLVASLVVTIWFEAAGLYQVCLVRWTAELVFVSNMTDLYCAVLGLVVPRMATGDGGATGLQGDPGRRGF